MRPKARTWTLALKLGVPLLVVLAVLAACSPAATPTPTPAPTNTPTTAATGPTATPTQAVATPTPTAAGPKAPPNPKNAVGNLSVAVTKVEAAVGLNRAGSPDQVRQVGVGETFFRPVQKDGSWDLTGPWLATSYDLAPDLSKVTIHLKQGVQFHKGWGEMTAEDAVWSMNDANGGITKTSIHSGAGDMDSLFKEWKVIDPYTIEAPFKSFDVRWADYHLNYFGESITVFSKKAYDEKGEAYSKDNLVATGPFEAVEWVRNDHVTLNAVANHHYLAPKVKSMRIIEVPEEGTRMAMLRTGEVDIIDADVSKIGVLKADGFTDWQIGEGNQMGIFFSGNLWEEKHALTGDPLDRLTLERKVPWIGNPAKPDDMEDARKIREAMNMAIDREAINRTLLDGLGYPAYITYLDPRDPHWQAKWNTKYDPEAAKALLAQTTYPKGFDAAIYVGPELGGGTGLAGEMADAIAGYWSKIGIKTEIDKYAYAAFRPSVVGRTNTIPYFTTCDEGKGPLPWDWPKAIVETSLTRKGYSCGLESPFIAQNYLKMSAEPDREKRAALASEYADYQDQWVLDFGVVGVPLVMAYNPKSIASWQAIPYIDGNYHGFDTIVPANR